ncbi:MAG: hypothetical protein ABI162_00085 [Luteolibacter sp.]
MKKSTIPLIFGLCAVGLLSGFVGRRLTGSGSAPAPAKQVSPQEKTVGSDENFSAAPPAANSRPVAAKKSRLHSTDTLETLATLDNDSLYSRLALWMMDASEQDIAAYWATAKDKKDRPNQITDLIFIHWTWRRRAHLSDRGRPIPTKRNVRYRSRRRRQWLLVDPSAGVV